MLARITDKDAAHHLRGHRKEMLAALPVNGIDVHQLEVGLMHEPRRIERVIRTLISHPYVSQSLKLTVEDGNDVFQCLLIAFSVINKELSDVWVCAHLYTNINAQQFSNTPAAHRVPPFRKHQPLLHRKFIKGPRAVLRR